MKTPDLGLHMMTFLETTKQMGAFRMACAMCAGAQFEFMAYLRQSMEDDYASLVGLGLAMWVFLIVFVLLSSVWGALTFSHLQMHACHLIFTPSWDFLIFQKVYELHTSKTSHAS